MSDQPTYPECLSDIEMEKAITMLSKLSTAPDSDTPNWMEADIRRGFKECRNRAVNHYEPIIKRLEEENAALKAKIEQIRKEQLDIASDLDCCFKNGNDQCDGDFCQGCWKDIVRESSKKLTRNTEQR